HDVIELVQKKVSDELHQHFEESNNYKPQKADWLEGKWKGLRSKNATDSGKEPKTGVENALLKKVGEAISSVPDDFALHRKLNRFMDGRRAMVDNGQGVDWAMGEALAFGTLLEEGYVVRLSGQDCGRGTFTQRHAVLKDQVTEERYVPLNH